MHNDVHKVTARNKWRVSKKYCLYEIRISVCMSLSNISLGYNLAF
jgi:hypothetical protein